VGCFSQLSISRFGSCFTKKPDFGTPKMEKALFVVDPSWEFPALRPRLSRVLSHVCEEGDTLEIDVSSLSIVTHVATYIWGK
jgi:hypothetical protein